MEDICCFTKFNVRKHFLIVKVISHWHRLPRVVETTKTWLDTAQQPALADLAHAGRGRATNVNKKIIERN